jgi:integrase
VVVDALGRPVRPEWYSDRFRALCAGAKVPTITLHAVRHSLAFLLHKQGVSPADAAALLGHTVEVHLSTYLPHSGGAGIDAAATALSRAAAAHGHTAQRC